VADDATDVGSVDEYIAQFPAEAQALMRELRALIKATAPDVTETISYGMPSFDLEGRHVVHFAGWKHHIGFYPVPDELEGLTEQLARFKRSKGTAQFPLDQPLPAELIRRVVELRVHEVLEGSG
jgi:uncharacterized protein YdhG (YjbR/CyaY superfamily)